MDAMSPTRACAADDLPLFDPDRDLVAMPGVRGGTGEWADRVRSAHAEVEARVRTERVMRVLPPNSGRQPELFPVLPAIGMLHPQVEPELRRRVVTVVHCLQRLVRSYPSNPELQEFLAVPPVLHQWIMRENNPGQLTVDFCRLDLLGDRLGTTRVLEFNPSSPGAVISTGMLTRFWRESAGLGGLLAEWGVPSTRFEQDGWFVDWLLAFGARHGLHEAETTHVGLFHEHESSKFEFDQIRRQLLRRERTPVECVPDNPRSAAGIRLGYLKQIPVSPAVVETWDAFCTRLVEGDLVVPNPLAERWVAENKLCLAALSDPRFRPLFTEAEQDVLDALVPWSRKLGDGITAAEAVTEQKRLVLKEPYSCRGESVHIGQDCSPETWSQLVHAPQQQGWLAQEHIAGSGIDTAEGPYFRDLCAAVLDGEVIGYTSRFSQKRVLNASKGGGAHIVMLPRTV